MSLSSPHLAPTYSTYDFSRVNTKATLFAPLDPLEKRFPQDLINEIKASSTYYKSGANRLVIQSQKHRSQRQNRSEVLKLLDSEIRRIAAGVVARETAKGPPKQR